MVAVVILVNSSYSWVPGLAWYRFSKYVAMCSLVSSGFVISLPSSVMVLYSSSLFPPACLLACHMLLGSISVLLHISLSFPLFFFYITPKCVLLGFLSSFACFFKFPFCFLSFSFCNFNFIRLCFFFALSVLIFTILWGIFIILPASSYSIDPSSVC